jgi:hypothetical protein
MSGRRCVVTMHPPAGIICRGPVTVLRFSTTFIDHGRVRVAGLSAVLDFTNLPSRNFTRLVPDELRTMLWLPAMMPSSAGPPAIPSPYKGFLFPNQTLLAGGGLLNGTVRVGTMYWGLLDGLPEGKTDSSLGLPDGMLPLRNGAGTIVASFHPSQSGNPYLYFGVGGSATPASTPLGYTPGGVLAYVSPSSSLYCRPAAM